MNAPFKIPTQSETEPVERKFDLRSYINFAWRHWMFIGAVTGIALIVGVVQLMRATPLYTASTQVLLRARQGSRRYRFRTLLLRRWAMIENQLAILRSDSLLRRVVLKERLASAPPTKKTSRARHNQPAMKMRKRQKPASRPPSIGCEVRWRSGEAGRPMFSKSRSRGLIRLEPGSLPMQLPMHSLLISLMRDLIRPNVPRGGSATESWSFDSSCKTRRRQLPVSAARMGS